MKYECTGLTPDWVSHEQRALLHLAQNNNLNIAVRAYAGCGKSTLQRVLSDQYPRTRFLYLAYNKSLQLEAQGKFGPHVTCKTVHGLAFATVGRHYAEKNKLGNLRLKEIGQALGLSSYVLIRGALATVGAYLNSADPEIGEKHLTHDTLLIDQKNPGFSSSVLKESSRLWAMMKDLNHPLSMPHDGYLKLYLNRNPDLSHRFEAILYDEAQDANPVVTQWLTQQPLPVVWVGDPYQAIYQFRGSENALQDPRVTALPTGYLTQTHRFGPEMAEPANLILPLLGETRPLVGAGKQAFGPLDDRKPVAYLGRTNAKLLDIALDKALTHTPFVFSGGVEKKAFSAVKDLWYALHGQPEKITVSPFLKTFEDPSELSLYIADSKDPELMQSYKMIHKWASKGDVPTLIDTVIKMALPDTAENRTKASVLSTAHSSKGLEFSQVIMLPDFPPLIENGTPGKGMEVGELCLLYVGVTRGINSIQVSTSLLEYQESLGCPLSEMFRGVSVTPEPEPEPALPPKARHAGRQMALF
jgi:hypothetical protein